MNSKVFYGPNDSNIVPNIPLGSLFYNKLQETPQSEVIFIDYETKKTITYGDLRKAVSFIAKKIQDIGVTKNDVVFIIEENSWKYVVLVIACFYVGAVGFLLNFNYTSSELDHFYSICEPKLIFCCKPYKRNITTISLNKMFEELTGKEKLEDFTLLKQDMDDIALILTSSGTTGFPKAVPITHSNFKAILLATMNREMLGLNKMEISISYLPFFHSIGICWALICMYSNCKNVILKKFETVKFLDAIECYRVSKLIVVPPVLSFLINHTSVENYNISSIRSIFCAGAPLVSSLEDQMRKKFPKIDFRLIYGMTEASGPVTIPRNNTDKKRSVGKPTYTMSIVICDKNDNFLSIHQTGEIRIKGPNVIKSYYKNEEASNKAFDKNGYFKTGDLGYFDEQGDFYIIGRLKEIIKYKGFQVAPAELESVLIKHESIKDVAVIGIPNEKTGELPMAFVVKKMDCQITEGEIVEYVKQNISKEKWLYGGVKFIETIPKNQSGKILRKKLQELYANN